MALFSKGIMLTQNKEPALSNPIIGFTASQTKHFTPKIARYNDPDILTPANIITLAEQAEIIDRLDNQPLARKLAINQGIISNLYIDAIDDEPYVSSRLAPLLQLQDEVVFGLQLCAKSLGFDSELSKIDSIAIEVYKNNGETKTNIPSKIGGFSVHKISGGYPALPSRNEQRNERGNRNLVIGVTALIHLSRAVIYNTIQNTTFITVAGNSILAPMNLEVSFGMMFAEVLNRCGLTSTPDKVVNGGSMSGISIIDSAKTVVTNNTSAILAFHGQKHEQAYSCIGCGRCETYCPSGLNPMYIHNIMERKAFSMLHKYDPQYCIACGICSYVCPSRLELAQSVKDSKDVLKSMKTNK